MYVSGFAVTVGVLAVVVGVFWSDLQTLSGRWADVVGSNLFVLVAVVVPWLIWRARSRLTLERNTPFVIACSLLALALIAWVCAAAAQIAIVQHALLPVIAWLAVLAVIGRTTVVLSFPLAWFWCAVFPWDQLTPFLQAATVAMTGGLLSVVQLPAYIEGNIVSIPAGTFEIASGCSGLNFFIVAFALSTLAGHLAGLSGRGRAYVLVLALVVAVIFNWMRVFLIIVVGQLTEMQSPLVTNHLLFGWAIYAVALFAFAIAFRAFAPDTSAVAHMDVRRTTDVRPVVHRAAGVFLMLASAPALWAFLDFRIATVLEGVQIQLPFGTGEWSGPTTRPFVWRPTFSGAAAESDAAYESPSGSVHVDITFYATQRPGAKLVGYGSNPFGSDEWPVLDSVVRPATRQSGEAINVREATVRLPDGTRIMLWQWYQIGTSRSVSTIRVKLLEAFRAFGVINGSASVAVATAYDENGADEARTRLESFFREMERELLSAAAGSGLELQSHGRAQLF